MNESGLSGSDALSVMNASRGNDGFFGGMDGAFWIFALLFLNNNGWGGNAMMNPGFVSQADLAASQNAQTAQITMAGIQSQIAQSDLTAVQAIANQTAELMQQNNTNLINAIQGFNSLSGQITNQTNVLAQKMDALSAQLNQCCCDIKTQMLQNQLYAANAKIVEQQNEISNAQQTQNILNQLGRYVPWAGTNTATATAAAG